MILWNKDYLTCILHTWCCIIDPPIFDVWDVTTGKDGINIHYEVKHKSKKIEIKWIKDGEVIDNRSKKYKGGDVDDSIFTITSPTLEDRGDYSCIVKNAVGNVKQNVHLGNYKICYFFKTKKLKI